MAIKSECSFEILLYGDGSSTSITLGIATAPFVLISPSSGNSFQPTFNLSVLSPTGINNVACAGPGGLTVTATLGLLDTITFSFNGALALNSQYTISGYFEF